LIYPWKRKRIFGTCLVEASVVDAHLKLPAILRDDNRVGQPPQVVDPPDKTTIKQLFDLFIDEVLSLSLLFSGLLLDRPDVRVNL
jgi:hypothetical protein